MGLLLHLTIFGRCGGSALLIAFCSASSSRVKLGHEFCDRIDGLRLTRENRGSGTAAADRTIYIQEVANKEFLADRIATIHIQEELKKQRLDSDANANAIARSYTRRDE